MDPDEYAAVRELSIAAFGDSSLGELLDALQSSWAWGDELSFVAHHDGELVGHVLYTHALLDAPSRLVDVLVLGPVGVRPDLQRSGIGGQLITRSLEVVVARTEPVVFLEGHPTYYPRFGFEQGAHLGFVAPSLRIPPHAFMALRLPSYEPWMTGTLVYPDAVWRADAVGRPRSPAVAPGRRTRPGGAGGDERAPGHDGAPAARRAAPVARQALYAAARPRLAAWSTTGARPTWR